MKKILLCFSLVFFFIWQISAQDFGAIKGQILDLNNEALVGITVSLQTLDRFTSTDENGYFLFLDWWMTARHCSFPILPAFPVG